MVGETQNGIFQKTPFLPSQASKAVKVLIAKNAVEGQNDFLGMRPLPALMSSEGKKGIF